MAIDSPSGSDGSHTWRRIAILAVAIPILLAAGWFLPVGTWLRSALAYIHGLGPAGPVVLASLYIVATILFVPGLILTIGAGALFGVLWGTVTVSIASTAGAALAFLLGRYVARDAVAKRLEAAPRFAAVDRAVARSGWRIVGLVRLSPLFPFNLTNYAFGLTGISFWPYLAASWAGMLPVTLVYVYIGSALGDIAAIATGNRSKTPIEYALFIVGLAAAIAVTVYVTRIANRALNEKVEERDLS